MDNIEHRKGVHVETDMSRMLLMRNAWRPVSRALTCAQFEAFDKSLEDFRLAGENADVTN